mmetsp:Transcript_35347/g.34371  ORF Transcript_35347/g.34371 Transcript_35347/m.34371 type:complete len:170 (+) Transcript_35347:246-755(+)
MGKRKWEVGVHITYTETSMCHRFITFEVGQQSKQEQSQFKEALDEFIRNVYREEQGSMMYHKVQESSSLNPDEITMNHPIQDKENWREGADEKLYTVCLIYDPDKKLSQERRPDQDSQKMVYLEEGDILGRSLEKKLGQWIFEFNGRVGDKFCLRRPRFSELRPYSLRQ